LETELFRRALALTAGVPALFASPATFSSTVRSGNGRLCFGLLPFYGFLPFLYQILVFAGACLQLGDIAEIAASDIKFVFRVHVII